LAFRLDRFDRLLCGSGQVGRSGCTRWPGGSGS
jgi:hypothetical protein